MKGIVYNEFWDSCQPWAEKVRFTVDGACGLWLWLWLGGGGGLQFAPPEEQYVFGMRGWRFSLASFGVLSLLTAAWIWPTWGALSDMMGGYLNNQGIAMT